MRSQALTPLFERKRELEAQITALATQVETDGTKAKAVADDLADKTARLENLNTLLADIDKLGEEAVEAVSGVINDSTGTAKRAVGLVEAYLKLIEDLDRQVGERELKLENIKKESTERLEEITRENGVLEVKRKDIDIYADRLQAFYYKHNLGELILPK